jgi:hypothetical protein
MKYKKEYKMAPRRSRRIMSDIQTGAFYQGEDGTVRRVTHILYGWPEENFVVCYKYDVNGNRLYKENVTVKVFKKWMVRRVKPKKNESEQVVDSRNQLRKKIFETLEKRRSNE